MSILGTRKRRLTALIAAAIVATGGGLAYAYWTGTGTGVGLATTGQSTDFTIDSVPSEDDPLIPGGPGQTIDFTVTNPSTGSQNLTNVTVTVANADGSPWAPQVLCSAADYTVSAATIAYGALAAGANVDGTVTITMNNLSVNQNGCQNVTVPLYFVAS